MSDLMKATEARKRIDNLNDIRGAELQEYAKNTIENAVVQGKWQVSLDVKYPDHDRMKAWLESLGYKVNCGDSQRDGSWFQVAW